eukprot:GHVO01000472.1.p1 GENE.GHVO01000472.1~~GHVO01000472.1.p1  ORF type:complete len:102 (+),score=2.75 GHVO01000472.1:44-307(+)
MTLTLTRSFSRIGLLRMTAQNEVPISSTSEGSSFPVRLAILLSLSGCGFSMVSVSNLRDNYKLKKASYNNSNFIMMRTIVTVCVTTS